jgi:hypothetical protein
MKLLRIAALASFLLAPVVAFGSSGASCCTPGAACCGAGCPLCAHGK